MVEKDTMEAAMAELDKVEPIQAGDIMKGVVLSVNSEEVIVNLNYMADGILPREEIEGSIHDLNVGDEISVQILKLNDGQGNVSLSQKKAEAQLVWSEFETLFNSETTFLLKIKEIVKGGAVGLYKSARVFVPASQMSMHFTEDLSTYVGETLEVKIVEFDLDLKKVVASHRIVEEASHALKKADSIARISPKDKLRGTVVRLANYGAFVSLGEVDGLIHISQMSWRRVKHPSEIVKEGDVVEVEVLSVDRETEKISLKLANIETNPWEDIYAYYQVDDVVEGKVVRLKSFGAFVALKEGVEGLVHISELSTEHVSKVSDVVKEGQVVEVLILSIDESARKIALSMKAVQEMDEVEVFDETDTQDSTPATLSDLFGDKLKNLKF